MIARKSHWIVCFGMIVGKLIDMAHSAERHTVEHGGSQQRALLETSVEGVGNR